MNLAYCQLLYKMRRKENFSKILLDQYTKDQCYSAILIANLFLDVPIKIQSFNEINNYIDKNLLIYCKDEYNYNDIEYSWYKFYLILCAYRDPTIDTDRIYQYYTLLPPINSYKKDIQWIIYRVKSIILSYMMILKLDYSKLVEELKNIPIEIRHLHF